MDSIMTYDEKASAYKVWSIFGETTTEGQILYYLKRKLCAITSAYGDGLGSSASVPTATRKTRIVR
jgi:hypothetical protein